VLDQNANLNRGLSRVATPASSFYARREILGAASGPKVKVPTRLNSFTVHHLNA